MAQMVSSYAFGRLCKEWPEVVLKINAASVGLDERSAAGAFEAVNGKEGKANITFEETTKKNVGNKATNGANPTCEMESLKRCTAEAEERQEIPAKKRRAL